MAGAGATPGLARSGVGRRARRLGGRVVRRFGLLPEGDPDGLGDDESLAGGSLPFSVMVYFPDTRRNLYQLRQWYAPLAALDARHRVGLVCLDSRTAAVVREETALPVLSVGRIGTLEDLVSRSDVGLALYVNHNVRNLHPLRFTSMLHAYLGHGESDKTSSASNQVKAYDYVLVPGELGRERIARTVLRYDVDAHVRLVGRPQLDPGDDVEPVGQAPEGERTTVLYAPTWEGAQPSMAYSSVLSHGPALLQSLLGSGLFHVVYRPHPRTGANSAAYRAGDAALQAIVEKAAARDPSGRHRVDRSARWDARSEPADLLVADVSAVVGDWLATDRQAVVTVPASPTARLDDDSVLSAVPTLTAEQAGAASDVVVAELRHGDPDRRRAWVRRAMGDTTPGVATARFLEVCEEILGERAALLSGRGGVS